MVMEHFARLGLSAEEGRIRGGRALASAAGTLLAHVLKRTPLDRFVVAGGDTSTAAVKQLDIDALEMVAPLFPGAPLCRALAPGRPLHGRELVLKGGQMGGPDFLLQARAGRVMNEAPRARVEDRHLRENHVTEHGCEGCAVTGAAMGIGAAIAEQLARDGMIVLVSDLDEFAGEQDRGAIPRCGDGGRTGGSGRIESRTRLRQRLHR